MTTSGPIPALRGYRHQFQYTLLRILNSTAIETVYPEKDEDYLVTISGITTEVTQVKNYSDPLRLSDLSPGKNNGFIRRSIDYMLEDPGVKINLIVIGDLGHELEEVKNNNSSQKIHKKLVEKFRFSRNEANIFIEKINIIQIDPIEMVTNITSIINQSIAGIDTYIAMDLLLFWIYQLAEQQRPIKRQNLTEKLSKIGQFINERQKFLTEFGTTIIPLGNENYEEMAIDEYQAGIAARYSHIEAGYDVIREDKLKSIDHSFNKEKVVILHGASGQGKSTLAYRYAFERFPNGYSFEISRYSKAERVLEIAQAVNALSRPYESDFLIIIDVFPGTNHWLALCRLFSTIKNCKTLVTIREEDLSRAGGIQEEFSAEKIKLSFNKNEAIKIFETIKSVSLIPHFLNFKDAWSRFGGKGPLLEFVFLLKQGRRLEDRLISQIQNVEERIVKENEPNQLQLLRYVVIASAHDCRIELKKILKTLNLVNPSRTIRYFENEYLLQKVQNGKYLEALHPVRAKILANILCDPLINTKKELFLSCQPLIIEEDWANYILQISFYYKWDLDVFKTILNFQPTLWKTCKDIHLALLWCGVNNYISNNLNHIQELRANFPMGFNLALLKLISPQIDFSTILNLYPKERKLLLEHSIGNFSNINEFFLFATKWLKMCHYPNDIYYNIPREISSLGYILFWDNKLDVNRGINDQLLKKITLLEIDNLIINETADLLLGLQHSNLKAIEISNKLLVPFIKHFKEYGNITKIDDDGESIKLHFYFDNEGNNIDTNGFSSKAMVLVRLARKAFPFKKLYSTQGYGHNFSLLPLPYDDSIKEIDASNMPWPWLTTTNQIFLNLIEYQTRFKDWECFVKFLLQQHKNIIISINNLNSGLQRGIEKGKLEAVDKLIMKFRPNTNFKLPKVAVDQWGFYDEIKSEDLNKIFHEVSLLQLLDKELIKNIKTIKKFHQSFSNFLENAHSSIVLKNISKNWSNQTWKDNKETLQKAGYSKESFRISKYNLQETWSQVELYQIALDNLVNEYHSEIKSNQNCELKKCLALLKSGWPLFIDSQLKKKTNIFKTAELREKQIINSFKRRLSIQLAKLQENGVCEDSEFFLLESAINCWVVLFYVTNVEQMLSLTDKFHNILKVSLGTAELNSFKRIVLENHIDNIRCLFLFDDLLLKTDSISLNIFDALNKESHEVSIAKISVVPEEIINELSLDILKDEIDEFLTVETYNRLFFSISQTLEYLNQLAKLYSPNQDINKHYLKKIKKVAKTIIQYVQDFYKIPFILNDHIFRITQKNKYYVFKTDFRAAIILILERFQELEQVLNQISSNKINNSLFVEIERFTQLINDYVSIQLEVYYSWFDLLMELKLR